MDNNKPDWLKSKGYLHITAQIDIERNASAIVKKVQNKQFVSRYAFYPLIHSSIDERRYKKVDAEHKQRAHSFTTVAGEHKRNIKSRPLHYATHMDAIIFGYYAQILQTNYECAVKKHKGLSECIIAYRKIEILDEEKNKSTIHFANEVFEEIRRRAIKDGECAVLTFDIKSFFPSLDHKILKKAWEDLFQFERLPDDHYNVFKAATHFSYILKDDLRTSQNRFGRKAGFDERELARIRNKHGIQAFFESPKSFREKVKSGELKLYKYPFRNKDKEPIGIPQGLPISAILANLYLLDFDLKVLDSIVNRLGCYYRRYSDDIVVVCNAGQIEEIDSFMNAVIEASKLIISKDKTEIFVYRNVVFGKKEPRLTSIKLTKSGEKIGAPFTYLGFEFNGKNALIKSANLGKFYRKMISSVKRKAKRALKIAKADPENREAVIYRRQLYKLYTTRPLSKTKVFTRWKKLVKNEFGEFRLVTGKRSKILRSNYLTYVQRASTIMNEPAIERQIKKHKRVFNEAVHRHFTMKKRNE